MRQQLRDSLLGGVHCPNAPSPLGTLDVSLVDQHAERQGPQRQLHHYACEPYQLARLKLTLTHLQQTPSIQYLKGTGATITKIMLFLTVGVVMSEEGILQWMNYQFSNRLHTESRDRLYTSPSRNSDSRPRFQRNSPHSNRTSPSRSSQEKASNQKFIKLSKINHVQLNPDAFFSGFSTEFVRNGEEDRPREQSPKKDIRNRENSLIRLKTLEQEMEMKVAELEETRRENARLKEALDKEIEKRKLAQKNLKANSVILSDLQRKCRENDMVISNLNKEVRFLEEKKYSKEDKIQFSFREKGLMEELKRLKAVQIANNNIAFLQRENRRLVGENLSLREENNYLRVAQQTIVHRLIHFQKQLKVAIKIEEEFFELRYKYQQLAKKERLQRKELERLKEQLGRADSLAYSSSSNHSLPKAPRTIKYHSHSRSRPNAN